MPVYHHALRSKLARATCAYLIAASAGTINDVLPNNNSGNREFNHTVVQPGLATEMLDCDGPYNIDLYVKIRGKATIQPGTTEYDLNRKAFDERVAKTLDALKQSNDGGGSLQYIARAITTAGRALKTTSDRNIASANQDMDFFLCDEWRSVGFGDGEPNEKGFWEEILIFKAICRSSDEPLEPES